MITRRHTSFWRYNLGLELAALLMMFVILFVAGLIARNEIGRKYLELRLADANRVHLFLDNHLDDTQKGLSLFIKLPEAELSPLVLDLFGAFSDIYRLDQNLRVATIYKATLDSRVFVGFSFSGGRLADYLKSASESNSVSNILRGYEDDSPSIYIAVRSVEGLLLGRLNLAYVKDFLTQFTHFSGTPLMLVAQDGFVMLSGDPTLQIHSLDLKVWSGAPSVDRTLSVGNRNWIPVLSPAGAVGATVVVLIPTELMDTQGKVLLIFLFSFIGLACVLVVLKNLRLFQLFTLPMATFAAQMRDLENGQPLLKNTVPDSPFTELADIQNRFWTMAQAIIQREQSLRESEERFRLAFDNANSGMCLVSADGRLLKVNDKMSDIFGYSRDELQSMTVNDLAHQEDIAISSQFIDRAIHRECDSMTFEKRYHNRQGDLIYCQVSSSLVRGADGLPRYFISQVQDITDRKHAEEQIKNLAYLDSLTKLPNRRLLLDRLTIMMASCKRDRHHYAVVFIDLNKFKQLNDTHGHDIGDRLLVEVADRLRKSVRESDTVARLGGDEFVVLLGGLPSDCYEAVKQAKTVVAKVQHSLCEPYILGDVRHIGSASVGLKIFNGEYDDPDIILKEADRAMYENKRGEIPINVLWSSGYCSGNSIIDQQHEAFFLCINELINFMAFGNARAILGNLIDPLVRDIASHFSDEERILADVGYPHLKAHAHLHKDLLRRIEQMKQLLDEDALTTGEFFWFITHDVVEKHILEADRDYFPWTNCELVFQDVKAECPEQLAAKGLSDTET
ncbi:membrane hypothetical protein [Azospirillaceae bacterium]